jgi:subtilase family serine protease
MASNSLPRLLVTSAFVVGLIAIGVPTASAAVQNRISAAATINTSPAAIPESVHPYVRTSTDLGATAGNTRLQGMSIRFNLTADQDAALDQLLADQQSPSSPRYHQWLTPAQYGTQFGLSSTDIAKVSSWLTNQGFTVTGVANGGTFITFDGTVAQAEAAFRTSIHNLSHNGETHFANVSDVQVPVAFASVVVAVTGLHNFRMKPHVHTSAVRPDYTSSVSGNHYMAPGDMYTIYNMTPLMNTYTGTGETIAVIGQVDINAADIAAFRSASGLNATNLPVVVLAGTDPGPARTCTNCFPNEDDLGESSIDLEWSGGMAPAATVDFVLGVDVFNNSMTYAIDSNVAPIVMSSYGACEAGWGTTEMNAINALFKQGNVQGQTIVAASADFGAADCDAGPSATEGLTVDFPASSPYVTGMGGTQPNEGTGTYWSTTNGSTGGSALSYIPEVAWNDASLGAFGGGGGGSSNYFIKPTWQVGTPADAARDVPDLSLNATDNPTHDSMLYCVNVAAGQSCGSGFRVSATNNGLAAAGGTSFDSQIFGGMLALVEQKLGGPITGRIGNANPTIYALGNSSKYYAAGQNTLTNATVVFNDVTGGNNQMACTAGTINCGNGGSIGYAAANGYDLATGWGSVNLTNLANDWTLVTPLGTGSLGSTLTGFAALTASSNSVASGATVNLSGLVGPLNNSTIVPTGTIQFMANNVALGSPVTVAPAGGGTASAQASFSWVTSCSNLGQQDITAYYSGDVNYQGSAGPALTASGAGHTSNGSFVVSPVLVQVTSSACPDFSLVPSTGTGITVSGSNATVTVAAGGTIPGVTVAATPANNFTGTVVFSAMVTNSTTGYVPTVTFSQPSAQITSSSAVSTTVTISGIVADLRMPTAPGKSNSHKAPWYAAGSGVTLASLLLLVLPRRRRLGGLLLVALAIALIGGTTGCGGSSQAGPSTGSTSTNVYAGTYIVTVVGKFTSTSGQVSQHVSTITYAIN